MSKAGFKQEFCAVATHELNALYRTALRLLRDHDEAEDAVQESLDKGWRNLGQLEAGARLKPWLFKILTNTCLDYLRSKGRRPQVEFNEQDHGMDDEGKRPARPDDQLHNRQVGQAINLEIDRLPADQQAVVQLVIVEQFSYEDAADALDVPVGTVRSRLSRARASLSEALKDVLGDADRPAQGQARLKLVK
ncbi:MAG: sigma-70 family RNA polymerase sigma factor [Rhizobiales bacterium]|nr:sigma-70 family RNA polymerase sigma factor [Hyphomicrobiales bacterium]